MKNCLFLAMTLILAHSALAETTIPWTKEGCESVKGTWIAAHLPDDDGCDTAHCNGMNFCTSNHGNMNWWRIAHKTGIKSKIDGYYSHTEYN